MSNYQDRIRHILEDEAKLYKLVESTFKALDIDISGDFDMYEVCRLVEWMSDDFGIVTPPEPEISETFMQVDLNNDGRISRDEYSALIATLLHQMLGE